jgi:hypothetical protein
MKLRSTSSLEDDGRLRRRWSFEVCFTAEDEDVSAAFQPHLDHHSQHRSFLESLLSILVLESGFAQFKSLTTRISNIVLGWSSSVRGRSS